MGTTAVALSDWREFRGNASVRVRGMREERRARAIPSLTSLLSLGSSDDWCFTRLRRFTRPGGTGGSRTLAERSLGCALSLPRGGWVRGKDFEMWMGQVWE